MAAGRPTLFVKEVKDKIIKAVSKGNYLCDAAESAGVDPSTLKRWMKQGRLEKSGEYFDFLAAIVKAEKQVISKCVEGVISQGKKDARHLQWYLERKCPEKWGKDTFQVKQLQSEVDQMKAEMQVLLAGKRYPQTETSTQSGEAEAEQETGTGTTAS